MPVHIPQNNRYDPRLFSFMPSQSGLHFYFVAIVRAEEIRTYEKQDDIGCPEMFVDAARPFLASACWTAGFAFRVNVNLPCGRVRRPARMMMVRRNVSSSSKSHLTVRFPSFRAPVPRLASEAPG